MFWKRSLLDALNETKTVKIRGVRFTIKKIDVLSHLSGVDVLRKNFAIWEDKSLDKKELSYNEKQVKEHYRSVFLSGVVSPRITASQKEIERDPSLIFVDRLFCDMELATMLYNAIVGFSYGKKKIV